MRVVDGREKSSTPKTGTAREEDGSRCERSVHFCMIRLLLFVPLRRIAPKLEHAGKRENPVVLETRVFTWNTIR